MNKDSQRFIDSLERIGVETKDRDGEFRNIEHVLDDLSIMRGTLSVADKLRIAKELFDM